MNKSQRKELYQKVYEHLDNLSGGFGFVCHIIENITGREIVNTRKEFPELCYFTSDKHGDCDGAFLTDCDSYIEDNTKKVRDIKLTILGFCIQMCENQ